MPHPRLISGLAEIADQFDAVLCDVWGVVHNGRVNFDAATEALIQFQQRRGPVVLISNSPRPYDSFVTQMRQIGTPDAAWSALVTSGDATRAELKKRAPGPALVIGDPREEAIYADLGLELTLDADEATFISCTSPYDDENDTAEDYRESFELLVPRGLEMVCANPDKVAPRGDKLVLCAGALAEVYQGLGGTVIMAGKPHAPIYQLAYAELERLTGKPRDQLRILAIGDGLPTDIVGANREDLPVLFIADGIHIEQLTGPDGRLAPHLADKLLGQKGAGASFLAPGLSW